MGVFLRMLCWMGVLLLRIWVILLRALLWCALTFPAYWRDKSLVEMQVGVELWGSSMSCRETRLRSHRSLSMEGGSGWEVSSSLGKYWIDWQSVWRSVGVWGGKTSVPFLNIVMSACWMRCSCLRGGHVLSSLGQCVAFSRGCLWR